jgi:hypothetical protein
MQILCFGPECTIWVTKLEWHPFYYIGTKMMFGSVSQNFANLRHIRRCNSCVSGLNALFWGFEVAMHPFYYIRPKMMFGSVPEYFTHLRDIKRCKSCVLGLNALFGSPNLSGIHSTTLEPKWCLGVFRRISLTFGTSEDAIVVFRAWMHYFEVSKLRCIHSILVDPKWRLGVF